MKNSKIKTEEKMFTREEVLIIFKAIDKTLKEALRMINKCNAKSEKCKK